jgi:hypothetical protein
MFEGVERQRELIFFVLRILNSDKDDVAQVVLSRRMVLRNHKLHPGRFKNGFVKVGEAMFQGVQMPCELIFCILGI